MGNPDYLFQQISLVEGQTDILHIWGHMLSILATA